MIRLKRLEMILLGREVLVLFGVAMRETSNM